VQTGFIWLRILTSDWRAVVSTVMNLRYEVLTAVAMKSPICCDITECVPLNIKVSEEHIASIFRVEVYAKYDVCNKQSFETLVDLEQTTRRYIPEDRTVHGNEPLGSIKC
jgi:hypothetical protein